MSASRDEVKQIINEAVACWHDVADDHDIKHCNCFRDAFVRRLIDLKLFDGYQATEPLQDAGSCSVTR